MSKKVKAIILKKIRDKEILNDALNQLNIGYIKKGKELYLNDNCKLIEKNGFYVAEILEDYYSTEYRKINIELNKLIQSILVKYNDILNEKIESLKRQNIEKEILETIQEEVKTELEIKRKKEILRLENIKKTERNELKQQIENSIEKIIESSKKNGYSIEEKTHEKERVLILIRR